MKIEAAIRLALREFADPACRRCRGRGYRGELAPDSACACVAARAPKDDDAADPTELPHPWGAVTRRAQQIHAASTVDSALPDAWG